MPENEKYVHVLDCWRQYPVQAEARNRRSAQWAAPRCAAEDALQDAVREKVHGPVVFVCPEVQHHHPGRLHGADGG
eukprot:2041913-Pyramimonas_sp.AAC.1